MNSWDAAGVFSECVHAIFDGFRTAWAPKGASAPENGIARDVGLKDSPLQVQTFRDGKTVARYSKGQSHGQAPPDLNPSTRKDDCADLRQLRCQEQGGRSYVANARGMCQQ